MIHTGIYDGIQGSVPITHSINFYNKLLTDLKAEEVFFVSDKEKLFLLEHRMPLGDFGSIGDRKLYLKKKYKNVELMIFEGNHELLPEYALSELLGEWKKKIFSFFFIQMLQYLKNRFTFASP